MPTFEAALKNTAKFLGEKKYLMGDKVSKKLNWPLIEFL